jgi:hypothetical protein
MPESVSSYQELDEHIISTIDFWHDVPNNQAVCSGTYYLQFWKLLQQDEGTKEAFLLVSMLLKTNSLELFSTHGYKYNTTLWKA